MANVSSVPGTSAGTRSGTERGRQYLSFAFLVVQQVHKIRVFPDTEQMFHVASKEERRKLHEYLKLELRF
jgi:hypothetical protein